MYPPLAWRRGLRQSLAMTTVLIHLVEDDPEIRDLVCALLAH
jgi:hypothetical protein